MRCGSCGHDNPAGRTLCDMCGDRLAAAPAPAGGASAPSPTTKRRTEIEPVGPPPSSPPNPTAKRRTEYEPPPRPPDGRPAPPPTPGWSPPADDPFSRSARPPLNPEDPWAGLASRPRPADPQDQRETPRTAVPVEPARATWGVPPESPRAEPPRAEPPRPEPPPPRSAWGPAPEPARPEPPRSAWGPAPEPARPEPPPPPPPAPPPAWGAGPRPPPPGGPPPQKSRTIMEIPGQAPPMQLRGALFEYRSPDDPGRIHPLRAGQNRVGRSPDRDVVLEGDPKVSAEHAFILLNGDQAMFVDNGSTNGSVVDGARIRAGVAELKSGSVLGIGDVRLVFFLVPTSALSGG